jgi:hypothetical protein
MKLDLKELHDASLTAVRFDWATRTCHFDFSGSPKVTFPFPSFQCCGGACASRSFSLGPLCIRA